MTETVDPGGRAVAWRSVPQGVGVTCLRASEGQCCAAGDVAGDEACDGVAAEGLAAAAREQRIVRVRRAFGEPDPRRPPCDAVSGVARSLRPLPGSGRGRRCRG